MDHNETEKRNIIKWHFVTDYNTGRVTGLRGWDSRLEQRYEMTQTGDPLIWRCLMVVDSVVSEDDWYFRQIHEGGVLDCMVEAEDVAAQRYQAQQEDDDEE